MSSACNNYNSLAALDNMKPEVKIVDVKIVAQGFQTRPLPHIATMATARSRHVIMEEGTESGGPLTGVLMSHVNSKKYPCLLSPSLNISLVPCQL